MGRFLDRFKGVDKNVNRLTEQLREQKNREYRKGKIKHRESQSFGDDLYDGIDDFDDRYDFREERDDAWIQPAQKPESFHHFILENQYKDLERSIRGYKDKYDKKTQQWSTVRKEEHCFTDEEAEEILRTAQSHLATDIKLSFINKDVFGLMMMALYNQIDDLFYSISEYRYGRYGNEDKQYQMKLQNRKIFLELWARIQANYSRAIQGTENRFTHDSVKGQESLQQSGMDNFDNKRYT
jgi:hypothetical protein